MKNWVESPKVVTTNDRRLLEIFDFKVSGLSSVIRIVNSLSSNVVRAKKSRNRHPTEDKARFILKGLKDFKDSAIIRFRMTKLKTTQERKFSSI